MSNDVSLIYLLIYYSVSQCNFSAFGRTENAISDHSSTGLTNSMNWIYVCWD